MSILDKCRQFDRSERVKEQGLYPYFRVIQDSEGPVVTMEGREVIMAGSNNYLGLTAHPRVKEASIRAIEKYGTSCSGSRFLTGTIDLHEEMEERIARYMGYESALLFSTGFQTGQGVIAPLIGRGDYLVSDKDNHASIVAGSLLAASMNANLVRYRHNDMDDLERRLSRIPPDAPKLIATDGVFSTFGTVVELDRLTALARAYDAQVVVDDAHGFGVIGPDGKGTAHHFGVQDDVDLVLCTFSKTLASIGGFVVGDERTINYLKHKSPALIFSASPTPASVASAIAALQVLEDEPDLPARVRHNAEYVRSGLRTLGFDVPDGETAIVPVFIGDDEKTFLFWRRLYDRGVFVNAFISPATPPGRQMLRTSYMATHETHHLDQVIEAFDAVGRELGILRAVA